MASVRLESLSTELLCQILQELPSPRDLYSLICTSTLFYRTFISQKPTILSNVVQRAIHPGAILDALTALKASKIVHAHSSGFTQTEILDFLHHYSTGHNKELLAGLSDLAISVPLCRLYSTINYFVRDFSSKALKSLHAQSCLDPSLCNSPEIYTGEVPDLSYTERGRL